MKPLKIIPILFSAYLLIQPISSSIQAAGLPLKSGTDEEIVAAIDQAVANKKPDVETAKDLIKLLKSSDTSIRVKERAAWAAGELKIEKTIPALIDACANKGLLVRSAALNSLIHMKSTSALSTYIDIAKNDPILSMRQRATLALGLTRSTKAIDPVVKLSLDEREEVRGAAALAMSALHSTKNNFKQAATEMKADPSAYVQVRARITLDIIDGDKMLIRSHLSSADPDVRLFVANYLRHNGKSADVKEMKSALAGDADSDVRSELELAIKAIETRAKKEAAAKKSVHPKKSGSHAKSKPSSEKTKK